MLLLQLLLELVMGSRGQRHRVVSVVRVDVPLLLLRVCLLLLNEWRRRLRKGAAAAVDHPIRTELRVGPQLLLARENVNRTGHTASTDIAAGRASRAVTRVGWKTRSGQTG